MTRPVSRSRPWKIQSVQTEEWLTGLGYSLARDPKSIGK